MFWFEIQYERANYYEAFKQLSQIFVQWWSRQPFCSMYQFDYLDTCRQSPNKWSVWSNDPLVLWPIFRENKLNDFTMDQTTNTMQMACYLISDEDEQIGFINTLPWNFIAFKSHHFDQLEQFFFRTNLGEINWTIKIMRA